VIVAANVIHATKNLHETLEHVAWLMSPGGAFVLFEATNHPTWFDVTTGLISGWQRFADDLRHDVPLIAPTVWEGALRAHGFEEVLALPQPGVATEVLGQHVIVSRGPSVIEGFVSVEVTIPTSSQAARGPALAERQAAEAAEFRQKLAGLPESERHEQLVAFVRDRVVQVLRLDPTRPPARDQRLMDFGVDSLMAVEFRNVLTASLGLARKLPATLIFDHPTVEAIAVYLQKDGTLSGTAAATEPAAGLPPAPVEDSVSVEHLEEMAEEDVEALLNKRLETL